jgi:hypothetical protein
VRVGVIDVGFAKDTTCLDCGHSWLECPGELKFTTRPASLVALLLLTPKDERGVATDQPCRLCGHKGELHDILGGCVYHDSEGPCLCEGYHGS